ncbi:MAG: hypothetical protein ACPHL6_13575, partial [Rubripirellula sp.]
AQRVITESNTDQQTIRRCFELAFGRQPDSEELEAVLRHWRQLETSYQSVEIEKILAPPPAQVIREAVEENTGERFQFTEKLYSNEDYVPDLNLAAVDRHLQSLADICVVLFNSNEFVYIY